MAGLNLHRLSALTAALSSSRWPLECWTRELVTLPSAPTSSARITVPVSPLRIETTGYGGLAQALASASTALRIAPLFDDASAGGAASARDGAGAGAGSGS